MRSQLLDGTESATARPRPTAPARFLRLSVDPAVVVTATVLTFVICALAVVGRDGLYLESDEYGLFAVGAHFAGRDWSAVTQQVGYYSFLFPLLWIAPAFAVFGDIDVVYASTLWINAVLASTIPVLSFLVARHWGFRRISSPWVKLLILLWVALGGPLVAYASLGLAEVQLAVLFLLMLLLLLRLQDRPTIVCAGVLGATAIAAYYTHQRSIGAVIGLIASVCGLWLVRRIRLRHVMSLVVAVLSLYILGEIVKRHVMRAVWLDSATAQGNDFGGRVDGLANLINPSTWSTIVQVSIGQLWAIAAATLLVGPVAVVLLGSLVARRFRARRAAGSRERVGSVVRSAVGSDVSQVFLLSSAVLTFGVSVFAMMEPQRLDHYLYQRYAWFLLPALTLWVLVNLAAGVVRAPRWWQVAPAWLLVAGAAIFVIALHASMVFMRFNAVSLSPFLEEIDAVESRVAGAVVASGLALAGLAIICVRSGTLRGAVWTVVLAAATALSIIANADTVAYFNRYVSATDSPVRELASSLDPSRSVAFGAGLGGQLFRWQFHLPEHTLRPANVVSASSDGYLLASPTAFFDTAGEPVAGAFVGVAGQVVVVDQRAGSPVACSSGMALSNITRTQTDDPTRPGLQNEGRQGYLAYGQYMDLPAGEYTTSLAIETDGVANGESTATDVALRATVSAIGGELIAERILTREDLGNLNGDRLSLDVPFEAAKPLENAEVQVWVADGVHAEIAELSLACAPPSQPTWVFRAGGAGVGMLGEGWSEPEHWGTWSDGSEASVHLTLPDNWSGDARLTTTLNAFVPPGGRAQHVEVWVADERLGEWQVDKLTSVDVRVPAAAIVAGGVDLVFSLPDALSPAQARVSADHRLLGVGLHRIALSVP